MRTYRVFYLTDYSKNEYYFDVQAESITDAKRVFANYLADKITKVVRI